METKDILLKLHRQAGDTVAKCYFKRIKLHYFNYVCNLCRIEFYGVFAFLGV